MHEPSMKTITDMFQSRGIHMVESNRRQALMIEGSDPLHNETGLLSELHLHMKGHILFFYQVRPKK